MSAKERILSLELIEMNKRNPEFLKRVGVAATIAKEEKNEDLNKDCGSTLQNTES